MRFVNTLCVLLSIRQILLIVFRHAKVHGKTFCRSIIVKTPQLRAIYISKHYTIQTMYYYEHLKNHPSDVDTSSHK